MAVVWTHMEIIFRSDKGLKIQREQERSWHSFRILYVHLDSHGYFIIYSSKGILFC